MDFTLASIQIGRSGFSLFRFSTSTFVRFITVLSFSYVYGGRFLNRSLLGYHHSTVEGIRFISILFVTFQLAYQTSEEAMPGERKPMLSAEPSAQRATSREIPVAEVEKV